MSAVSKMFLLLYLRWGEMFRTIDMYTIKGVSAFIHIITSKTKVVLTYNGSGKKEFFMSGVRAGKDGLGTGFYAFSNEEHECHDYTLEISRKWYWLFKETYRMQLEVVPDLGMLYFRGHDYSFEATPIKKNGKIVSYAVEGKLTVYTLQAYLLKRIVCWKFNLDVDTLYNDARGTL